MGFNLRGQGSQIDGPAESGRFFQIDGPGAAAPEPRMMTRSTAAPAPAPVSSTSASTKTTTTPTPPQAPPDPVVVDALTGTGMSQADARTYASQVSVEEAKSLTFVTIVKDKIASGSSAQDAIEWGLYSGYATDAEMSDPVFREQLTTSMQFTDSPESTVYGARQLVHFRNIASVSFSIDHPMQPIAELPQDLAQNLLQADPEVAKAMLGSGMTLNQVASTAHLVTSAEVQDPEFMTYLNNKLGSGMSGQDAVFSARYADDYDAVTPYRTPDIPVNVARAYAVSDHLGVPVTEVLGGEFDAQQTQNLLNLDPTEVNSFMDATGVTLSQVAQLTPRQFDTVTGNRELARWSSEAGIALTDFADMTVEHAYGLSMLMVAGFEPAAPDATFDNVDPDSVIAAVQVGNNWLIPFRTTSGDRVVTSSNVNPALTQQVGSILVEKAQADINQTRAANGLPPVMSTAELQTTRLNDPNDPTAGYQTLGQAAFVDVVESYRTMLENGQITSDDPRAQFVRVVEANAALGSGYSLLPYMEVPVGFRDNTSRVVGEPVQMSTADVNELLDADAVQARFNELMADPTISADYQARLTQLGNDPAVVPGGQEAINTLYNSLTGPNYPAALASLKDQGLTYEAEQMVVADLRALALLSPEKAAEAAKTLAVNSFAYDVNATLQDPSALPDEAIEQALRDNVALTIRALRTTTANVFLGTLSAPEVVKFYENFMSDKTSVDWLVDSLRQLVTDAKNGLVVDLNNVSLAEFEAAMDKTYIPGGSEDALKGFFDTALKTGTLGSMLGGTILASFGYKMYDKSWTDPGLTEQEQALARWGAARDVLAFASVSPQVAKFGATGYDVITSLFGGASSDPNRPTAIQALGLDKTVPELWPSADGTPGSWSSWWAGRSVEYDQLIDVSSMDMATSAAVDDIGNQIFRQADGVQLPGSKVRVATTVLRGLEAFGDFASVADIVTGAITIKNAQTPMDKVNGSISVISGSLGAVAGGIEIASLFGAASATAVAAVGPLFMVGAVLGIGALIGTAIYNAVQQKRQEQQATLDQNEWFGSLAEDGLADPDWAEKLEYMHYAWMVYGNDNPNSDQSYIDYQHAEWEYFRNKPQESGTSLMRLNEDLHVSNDSTKNNWPFGWDDPTFAMG